MMLLLYRYSCYVVVMLYNVVLVLMLLGCDGAAIVMLPMLL